MDNLGNKNGKKKRKKNYNKNIISKIIIIN
jgi:hypothetical protein